MKTKKKVPDCTNRAIISYEGTPASEMSPLKDYTVSEAFASARKRLLRAKPGTSVLVWTPKLRFVKDLGDKVMSHAIGCITVEEQTQALSTHNEAIRHLDALTQAMAKLMDQHQRKMEAVEVLTSARKFLLSKAPWTPTAEAERFVQRYMRRVFVNNGEVIEKRVPVHGPVVASRDPNWPGMESDIKPKEADDIASGARQYVHPREILREDGKVQAEKYDWPDPANTPPLSNRARERIEQVIKTITLEIEAQQRDIAELRKLISGP